MKKYPLSKTEYGIYIEQTARGNTAYNLPLLIGLPDDIDTERFESAVTAVVQNHPALLTSFGVDNNGEVYKYHRFDTVQIEHINTDAFEPYDYVAPFDLHNDCLCRFFIVTTPSGKYFFFDVHHIIFDGTSSSVFLSEIDRVYNGEAIAPEDFSADAYAEEEQQRLNSDEYLAAKRYYQSVFEGVDVDTAFFTDQNERESGSKEMSYSFGSVDSSALKSLAKANGVKLSTVFNAAFSYLLGRYTNSPQVLYSTVHHGRDARLMRSLGMFVKTYPVYAEPSDDTQIGDFLKKLDAHIEQNRKNDLYSFADFCSDFHLNPSVLFAYQGDMIEEIDFCGGRHKVKLIPMKDTKSGFELTVWRENGLFTAHAEYDPSLYNDEVVRAMLESFDKILHDMLYAEKLGDIDMLTEIQRKKLDENNRHEKEYEITDIVTLFRRQAAKSPDHIAAVYLDKQISYGEIDRITENIAAFLHGKGVGREDVVSILIPRGEFMPIASLGVLKAGAGYQPLDPSYPVERLEFMVKDASAKYVIADRGLMDRLPNYEGPVLYTDEIASLPTAETQIGSPAPEDLFIMLYTSGSTGVPKGVMLEHRNLCCFCEWYRSFYKLDENSRVAAYASYGFDACMMDMYPALTSGAQVHIIAEEIRLDLLAIKDYFYKNRITHSFMTTQVGRQYADLFPDALYPHHLSTGGEKLVPIEPPTGYSFYNAYGPTECTIFTNLYKVDRLYERVPIGKPLDNLKQYVVDSKMRRVPAGVPGELIVAGHQVSRGYLNRPEQKAFIDNPFESEKGYEKAYRTGDVVRMLPDGVIDFVGRNDGQVKIRGFRIELSEVEGIIRKFKGIKDATVQAFDENGGGKFIAAYIVSDETVDIGALNAFIKENKPPYMVPAVTMQIDRIPLNQNQKVNKRALPVPEKQAEETVPPENKVQQRIFDCIAEVIGTRNFGITTDIFDAGLNSIGAIKLNVLLSNEFNVPVAIQDLRKNSTVKALEAFLISAEQTKAYDIQPDYPITQTQNGIFVACIAEPNTTMYNIPFLITLSDQVDIVRLQKAVNDAFAAHPYLHTTLFMNERGDIRAKREDSDPVTIAVEQVGTIPPQDELVRPYDLMGDRLCRAVIYQTESGNYLFLDFHHIIFDGASAAVLLQDIADAYDGKEIKKETFTGFEAALAENEKRNSEQYQKAKAYYDSIFRGCDSDCLPKADRSGEKESSGFYTKQTETPIAPIRRWCERNGVTLNAFFNAVFGYVVSRYNFSDEAVFTTIYNGRSGSESVRSTGMFVKTLPVYCNIDPQLSVSEYVKAVGDQLIGSMENDIYSFSEIAAEYEIQPDISIAYQDELTEAVILGGETCKLEMLTLDTAKFPLSVDVYLSGGKLRLMAEYRADMFSEALICGFVDAIETAAARFIADQKLSGISLLTEKEAEAIAAFNTTDYPVELCSIPALFERQVQKAPDRVAVIADGVQLTYWELNERANRIAHTLLDQGIVLGETVGMLLPRTVDAIAAEYGIMKAGGAFLPMLPSYPDDRIDYCLTDSSSRFVITTDEILSERSGLLLGKAYEPLTVSKLYQNDAISDPDIEIPTDSLAYCIYTSGSTGTPKGVMIEHGNLCNFVNANPLNHETVNFVSCGSVALSVAAFSFDFSLMEIHITLCNGMTLCIAGDDEIHNPLLLAQMIEKYDVDVMSGTPSFFANVLDIPQAAKALKNIGMYDLGAEAFPPALYGKLRKASPKAVIVNGYGPTEATISCISKVVESPDHITIGTPAANVHAYIFDKCGNLLPMCAKGELVIGGLGVGRGYVNLPDKTADVFITVNGERAYRTGDIARIDSFGEIEFFGRLDNQVKLRGLRVELDEIVNVMQTCSGVKHAIVIVRGEGEQQYLCAYYTTDGTVVEKDALVAHMKQSLAHYMIPSVFVQLDEIPLTSNGKIDKKALPEPEFTQERHEGKAPATALQKQLCEIFAYALGTDAVNADDNFFEIGGTSLLASKVAVRAMAEDLPIAFKDVFDYPTAIELEEYINRSNEAQTATEAEQSVSESSALAHNVNAYVDEIHGEEIGDILLTGATGFLGAHVLRHLIGHTDKKIYCLLRGGSDTPDNKLKNILMYYFETPYEEFFGDRIITVSGDITDRDGVMKLADIGFGCVINCAACVKHFVQDDSLERINWHGVENLIDLCVETGRRLVQVSTVSVAGTSVNGAFSVDRKIRENELFFGQNLDNKYVYTKFKAEESLLRAIEERGLDGKIVRVGNLMSRYSDGLFQINSVTNGFMRSLRAYAALGVISVSALDELVEFSPIDCTASAVVTLASANSDFTVFHATNGHRVQMGDVIEAMNQSGIRIDIVSASEFGRAFNNALNDEKLSEAVSPLISYQASDQNTVEFFIDYDNAFTTKALYRLGFKWPIINEDYLKNVFDSLDSLAFFDEV
ncbi:MAG: amino acid adenylation domain-containing protein [Ruminococcus sp.]|nr:amino acid adenylation domain-containing protein [Ruminococcus sp.]